MKKVLVCLVVSLAVLLSGCQPSNPDNSDVDNSSSVTDSTEFMSYEVSVTGATAIYDGLGYENNIVGSISDGDVCTIVEEVQERQGYHTFIWGKLENGAGWINLNEATMDISGSQMPDDPNSAQGTPNKSQSDFEPYQVKIKREISVYSSPYSPRKWLYDISDKRTVTIVEETDVMYSLNDTRIWGRLDTDGWIDVTRATQPPDFDNDDVSTPTPEPTKPAEPSVEPDIPSTIPTKPNVPDKGTGSQSSSKPDSGQQGIKIDTNLYAFGKEHTQTVGGVTFHWYDRYEIKDKQISLDINSFRFYFEKGYRKEEWVNGKHIISYASDSWTFDFDVKVSAGGKLNFWWSEYNKDNYFIKKTSSALHGGIIDIREKCKGSGQVVAVESRTTDIVFIPFY